MLIYADAGAHAAAKSLQQADMYAFARELVASFNVNAEEANVGLVEFSNVANVSLLAAFPPFTLGLRASHPPSRSAPN